MNRGRNIRAPYYVWIVYDPTGKPRNITWEKPQDDMIAWPYAADDVQQTGRSGNSIRLPEDYVAAKAAGYRIKKHRLYQKPEPAEDTRRRKPRT